MKKQFNFTFKKFCEKFLKFYCVVEVSVDGKFYSTTKSTLQRNLKQLKSGTLPNSYIFNYEVEEMTESLEVDGVVCIKLASA